MATLTIPYEFTAGTPAIAEQINENFAAVAQWTNGEISTNNIGVLTARSTPLSEVPQLAILSISQTASQPVIHITNEGTDSSLQIEQLGPYATANGAIVITDNTPQNANNSAQLLMNISSASNIPAILINHSATKTLSVGKTQIQFYNAAVEISSERIKLPSKTTVERNAITQEGSVLYNNDTDQLNIRRADVWMPIDVPVGSMQMFAGSTAPEGWLLCGDVTLDSVANPQYAKLFAVIGITYGGTGASNFKLPDTRGRTTIGVGTGTGLTNRTLGSSGGAETHLLTSQQSGQKAVTTSNPNIDMRKWMDSEEAGSGNNYFIVGNGGEGQGWLDWNHVHTIPASDAAQAHNNMQPFLALNFIIKY